MFFSTSQPIISRPLPSAVRYDLSEPYQTTITLPPGSTWSSGLHWHESHTEYLEVIQGAVQVFLEGKTQIIRAKRPTPGSADPVNTVVCIPRYAWHQWQRAPVAPLSEASNVIDCSQDEDAVVVERTEPADIDKSIFFWNLNGVIISADAFRERYKLSEDTGSLVSTASLKFRLALVDIWLALNLFVIFRELDNFPVFVNIRLSDSTHRARKRLDMILTHLLLRLAGFVGALCGVKAVRRDFTPLRLWEARSSKRRDLRKYD